LARRVVCVLVLLSVCAASFPLPVPIIATSFKDRSIPFPCQDHPCGCRDAKQCWTTCGCLSMTEKLRWAEARGIAPPNYVDVTQVTKPSCRSGNDSTCCGNTSPCDSGSGGCKACGDSVDSPETPERYDDSSATPATGDSQRIVLLTSYIAKCHGQDSLISSLPWSIVSRPQVIVHASREPDWRWNHFDERSLSALPDPPIPPPRLA